MPRGPPGGDDRPKPEMKAKPEKMKRPEGMSREAFALLGGSNPVIPTHLLGATLVHDCTCFKLCQGLQKMGCSGNMSTACS